MAVIPVIRLSFSLKASLHMLTGQQNNHTVKNKIGMELMRPIRITFWRFAATPHKLP